ncbi:MAG TPA: metallophosphoesterase [Gammaproteobacteria bacterium]|nr:metallophosphoesterase [Gammaproteobacteria bacterium]
MHKRLRTLPRNEHGRDLVVGDLHGSVRLLESELARISFDPAHDRVIAVGDLVDRGPDGADIDHLLLQPWFYSVLGNHDVSFAARLIVPADWVRWEMPHFHRWAASLDGDHIERLRHLIAKLPWALEVDTEIGLVGIVHAEVPMGFESWRDFTEALNDPSSTELRWQALTNRELHSFANPVEGAHADSSEERIQRPGSVHLNGVAHVIHGHDPAFDRRIHRLDNRYWIDCAGWEVACRPDTAEQAEHPPRLAIVDARDPGVPL